MADYLSWQWNNPAFKNQKVIGGIAMAELTSGEGSIIGGYSNPKDNPDEVIVEKLILKLRKIPPEKHDEVRDIAMKAGYFFPRIL
jgi:hypothetical protein